MKEESPEYVRISLAAAMTLGFKSGLFYRNAVSPCVNILLTYDEGCIGNCGYCGLSSKRPGTYTKKSFIRVTWDIYKLSAVIERIRENLHKVRRICISMITNKRAVKDTVGILRELRTDLNMPISVLASPTILREKDLMEFRNKGVDRIGVAVDAATPYLFESIRGKGVRGPHKWDKYWKVLRSGVSVFGRGQVGVHLIVGLGETEEAMVRLIQHAHDQGIETHLFTFFPESDSILAAHSPPMIGHYRRIQLARYLINNNLALAGDFEFDKGRIASFRIADHDLGKIIDSGKPFMTSGCPGMDGEVACNRPYSDSLPGPDIRNFPFLPETEDIEKIRSELWQ